MAHGATLKAWVLGGFRLWLEFLGALARMQIRTADGTVFLLCVIAVMGRVVDWAELSCLLGPL